jgi:hypothetical protein
MRKLMGHGKITIYVFLLLFVVFEWLDDWEPVSAIILLVAAAAASWRVYQFRTGFRHVVMAGMCWFCVMAAAGKILPFLDEESSSWPVWGAIAHARERIADFRKN